MKQKSSIEESMAMDLIIDQNPYLFLLWCLIFFLVAFKLTAGTRSCRSMNLPPSPPKLPFIGNLHQIGTLSHRSLKSLSDKYGPLMFLKLGQIPTVVVTSANLVGEMASADGDAAFSSRTRMTAAEIYFHGWKDVSLEPYGEGWRYKRRISVAEFLSLKKVRSFQFIREEEVSNLINKIHEACSKNVPVNLMKMLLQTSYNVHCRCVFGRRYDDDDDDGESRKGFKELVMKMMIHFREFSFGDFSPKLWWMDFVTGLLPKVKANFRELDDFINHEIELRKSEKRNNNAENDKNLLDMLLPIEQEDDIPDVGLSLASIKTMLLVMIVGGMETTSTCMEWVMAELMRNPEKMKKAQEEVRRVLGNHKSKIEESDVNQMTYLRCVVKETMRLHPPGPILFSRQTNSSVKLGGYDIPPKTKVIVNAWAIQRDPQVWESPEEFVPERFENSEVDFRGKNFELIPFGFGRRICPGIIFSVAAIEYTLVNLLYWFDWKLPSDEEEEESNDGKGIDMSDTKGMLSYMKLSLNLQPIPYKTPLP